MTVLSWIRRHILVITVAVLAVLTTAFFTWADWHQYVSDAQQHHQIHHSFWSWDFLAHWGDNAAQNWHSELAFGVLLVVLLNKAEGEQGEDKDDT